MRTKLGLILGGSECLFAICDFHKGTKEGYYSLCLYVSRSCHLPFSFREFYKIRAINLEG